MKAKTFDAVKFMRNTRDELSKKYLKDPEAQEKDLARIRKQYSKFKRTAANRRLKDVRSIVNSAHFMPLLIPTCRELLRSFWSSQRGGVVPQTLCGICACGTMRRKGRMNQAAEIGSTIASERDSFSMLPMPTRIKQVSQEKPMDPRLPSLLLSTGSILAYGLLALGLASFPY